MAPDFRQAEVDRALGRIRSGARPADLETETLDFKEDPSRRADDGAVNEGAPRSERAATLLAEASTCLANHEGGAVVVGVADQISGPAAIVGTLLDAGWIRARIRELTLPALGVSATERTIGARLLILLIPRNASSEPHSVVVSRSGGRRTPRRLGTGCQDMATLAEQIAWLEGREGHDWSASPSGHLIDDVRAAALEALREYLDLSPRQERRSLADLGTLDLARRLQIIRADGRTLTRAGARLLCAASAPAILYFGRGAPGQRAEVRIDSAGRGLIEELRDIERVIDGRNRSVPLPLRGLQEDVARAVAPRAIREALINAVMHRDWDIPEPIVVEHTADELVVFSPGGLFGVEIERLLTTPSRTRNRLLGDVLRSLGLAEREGTGIDRMYIEQIRLGHPPPTFQERAGGIRVVLVGGDPVPVVVATHAALPARLRGDARAAAAIDLLRSAPSITRSDLARAAQEDSPEIDAFLSLAEASGLLQATARPRPDGARAWRLSDRAREGLAPILPYYRRPLEESVRLAEGLARSQATIRNRDVQDLLGIASVRSSQVLKEAERLGRIRLGPGSAARGRSVWYVPTQPPGA